MEHARTAQRTKKRLAATNSNQDLQRTWVPGTAITTVTGIAVVSSVEKICEAVVEKR